ncbi:helix-turn-helix domain-containing protein [Wielerella bovis]|uniref:helix-turn-helix domain-containing protein n=1 Tax=Wielerella bovis TaxID=2917790 RepID=UPI002019B27D|nr:helix-turn-helix transcriptional regulator [Wielerella bovis]ULJ60947.1 helix-turn-helix domain-containing protein [Wielerella bovis]
MKINEKIRRIREINNISQETMAEKLGLSPSTYSKMERGLTNITLQRLEEIAQIFQMNVTELLESNSQIVCLISENHSSNYYGTPAEMTAELENLRLKLQHKDEMIVKQNELIEQQKRELATLHEIISLLKAK